MISFQASNHKQETTETAHAVSVVLFVSIRLAWRCRGAHPNPPALRATVRRGSEIVTACGATAPRQARGLPAGLPEMHQVRDKASQRQQRTERRQTPIRDEPGPE